MADLTASVAGGRAPHPFSGCIVGGMFGGNFLLLVLAILIARAPRWTLTLKDVLFWLLVGLVVLLRYVDLERFSKRTADDEPAIPRRSPRYVAGLLAVWFTLWALCHSVAVG